MGRRRRPETADDHRGERAAHAIYGVIIVLAVIVAEEGSGVSAEEAIASVLGAALVTALAEIYANYIGATIQARRQLSSVERHLVGRNVIVGFLTAILPAAYFVLAALGAMSLGTAFDFAIWTGVAILGAHAGVASRLAGASIPRSVIFGVGFTVLGAALVLLKTLA